MKKKRRIRRVLLSILIPSSVMFIIGGYMGRRISCTNIYKMSKKAYSVLDESNRKANGYGNKVEGYEEVLDLHSGGQISMTIPVCLVGTQYKDDRKRVVRLFNDYWDKLDIYVRTENEDILEEMENDIEILKAINDYYRDDSQFGGIFPVNKEVVEPMYNDICQARCDI